MTYKILNTRQQEQILFTEVEYNFNEQLVLVEIAHFSPQTKEEVETNIINRAQSELQKLQSVEQVSSLVSEVQLNEIKDINI